MGGVFKQLQTPSPLAFSGKSLVPMALPNSQEQLALPCCSQSALQHCKPRASLHQLANSPTLLAFSYKSGSAAGNGVSIAMCQTPAEGAINNGISHAGYVQNEHPLGNRSRTALVREILSKRTPHREMCRVIASTIISRVFSRVSAYLFYFIKKSYIEFQLFKCVVGCP